MTIPKALTTVTPLSKYLALSLFVLLPIIAFFLGARYGDQSWRGAENYMLDPVREGDKESLLIVEHDDFTTRGWRTYSNTKIGFTFKYPESFGKMIKPSGPRVPNEAVSAEDDAVMGITDGFSISFFPFKGSNNDLVEKRILNTAESGIGTIFPDEPIRKIGNVEFNGIKGEWYFLGYSQDQKSYLNPDTEVYFTSKDHGFIIRVDSNSGNSLYKINIYTLEQILSTFKFTN